ncbi:MAG: hypothetical protein WC087_02585 [Candidatus Paceibacterota bacterium]
MFKKPLIKEIFWFSTLIAVLHYLALKLYFYWTISWFDILMHLLGGYLIGLIALYLLLNFLDKEIISNRRISLILVLSFVLIVGLGWELWELFVNLTDIIEDRLDTAIDIVMDSIGGYFAFLYGKKHLWKRD